MHLGAFSELVGWAELAYSDLLKVGRGIGVSSGFRVYGERGVV